MPEYIIKINVCQFEQGYEWLNGINYQILTSTYCVIPQSLALKYCVFLLTFFFYCLTATLRDGLTQCPVRNNSSSLVPFMALLTIEL